MTVVFAYHCVLFFFYVYLSRAVSLIFRFRVEQLIGNSVSQSFILDIYLYFSFAVVCLCRQYDALDNLQCVLICSRGNETIYVLQGCLF